MDKATNSLSDDDNACRIFSKFPFFLHLDKDQIQLVLNHAGIQTFQAGQRIIREGDNDAHVYFLISGHVTVEKNNVTVSHLRRAGEIFGEMHMVDGNCRSASVVAQEETQCLRVDSSCLSSGDSEAQLVYMNILYKVFSGILVERLRKANNEIAYLRNELKSKGSR